MIKKTFTKEMIKKRSRKLLNKMLIAVYKVQTQKTLKNNKQEPIRVRFNLENQR